MRSLIGAAFLLAQLFSVVHAQFGNSRYFCWAPNDSMVSYRLEVKINGRVLGPEDIIQRYRGPRLSGVYQNAVQNLKDYLQQYETTYGRDDHAQILMRYSVNGRPDKEWRWPSQRNL